MKTLFPLTVILAIIALPFLGSAQSSKLVDRALGKALKKTAKADMSFPEISEAAMSMGESGSELSGSVNKALAGALKESKKSGDFTTDGLDMSQLSELASSEKPFSSLLDLKSGLRDNLESTVGDQLKKVGVMDMLSKMGPQIPGLDLANIGAEKAIASMLTDKAVGELDKMGSKLLGKLNF